MKKLFLLVFFTTLYFLPLVASSSSCDISNYKDFIFNPEKMSYLRSIPEVCELKNANLQGANLRNADFQGADLRGVNLQKAILKGANLRGADLRDADLPGANLYEVNFEGANLRDVDFRGADLREANLKGADLGDADFEGADLRGAKYNEATIFYVWFKPWKGFNPEELGMVKVAKKNDEEETVDEYIFK